MHTIFLKIFVNMHQNSRLEIYFKEITSDNKEMCEKHVKKKI